MEVFVAVPLLNKPLQPAFPAVLRGNCPIFPAAGPYFCPFLSRLTGSVFGYRRLGTKGNRFDIVTRYRSTFRFDTVSSHYSEISSLQDSPYRASMTSTNSDQMAPTGPSPMNSSKLLFKRHLDHLQLTLHPLLSVSTGQSHPDFPTSILHYHLLTEYQLDELAHFYHQQTPNAFSLNYPAPIIMRWEKRAHLEDKRRRFGRFIGLRGCASPQLKDSGGDVALEEEMSQEEMDRWLEMKIRRGIEREQERDLWRSKGF